MKFSLLLGLGLMLGSTIVGVLGSAGGQACVPAWLLGCLVGAAILPTDTVTEIVRQKAGVE